MELHKDTPILLFKNAKEWEEWLHNHHDKISAVWMKFAKKNSDVITITYDEALLVALCYGWIDGVINRFDEKFYLTRWTPRKAKSVWSKSNQEQVKKLLKAGKMQLSGMKAVEAAKANGKWYSAYDGSKTMQIPKDFLKELAKDKKALEFFNSLSRANTYAISWRLQTAKNPETRAKRMQRLLEMMKKGGKLH